MGYAELLETADRAVQKHLGGVSVIYTPAVGPPVTLTGMFDANYRLADQGNSGVEQTGPVVWLRLDDLPLNPDDDEPTITIDGIEYRVRERQQDSPGTPDNSVRLLLHRRI
jgi:hypothetical protein